MDLIIIIDKAQIEFLIGAVYHSKFSESQGCTQKAKKNQCPKKD
jgi:hypothetical protein